MIPTHSSAEVTVAARCAALKVFRVGTATGVGIDGRIRLPEMRGTRQYGTLGSERISQAAASEAKCKFLIRMVATGGLKAQLRAGSQEGCPGPAVAEPRMA